MRLRLSLEGRQPQPQDFLVKGPRTSSACISSSPRGTFPRGKSALRPPRKKMAGPDVAAGAETRVPAPEVGPLPPRGPRLLTRIGGSAPARGSGPGAPAHCASAWPGWVAASGDAGCCAWVESGHPRGVRGSGVPPAAAGSSSAAAGAESKAGRACRGGRGADGEARGERRAASGMGRRRAPELYRAPFPLYALQVDPSTGLLIAAGGGGAAKTGIKNGVVRAQATLAGSPRAEGDPGRVAGAGRTPASDPAPAPRKPPASRASDANFSRELKRRAMERG